MPQISLQHHLGPVINALTSAIGWHSTRSAHLTRTVAIIALLILSLLLGACGVFGGRDNSAKEASERRMQDLQELQLQVMRYADQYVGRIAEPLQRTQATTDSPSERRAAQEWKMQQATAAYTIASSPNPVANALDMIVLATLSRMVLEDPATTERYGDHIDLLKEAHRVLEPGAWELLQDVLTPQQIEQVRSAIEHWRTENSQVTAVAYVRLQNFSRGIRRSESSQDKEPRTLISALGLDKIGLDKIVNLDPFKDLDPAVREITQTRQLAERTIYYAQRAPNLIDMQIELLLYRLTLMPETQSLLSDVGRVSKAAESAGHLAATLPEVLAREREAAIRQFMAALNSQEAQTRQLMTELRATLEAGTGTSVSLTETIRSLDKFMERFDSPSVPPDQNAPPGKPFDINDYTVMARELGAAASQLQTLVAQLDTTGSGVTKLSSSAASQLQSVVDHAFWRGMQLILILVVAVLVAAMVYRVAERRLRSERDG